MGRFWVVLAMVLVWQSGGYAVHISDLKGDAILVRKGVATPLVAGFEPQKEDQILTAAGGVVTLDFSLESRLILGPNSRLELVMLNEGNQTKLPYIFGRLPEGEMSLIVPKNSGQYRFWTPKINLSTYDTGLILRARPDEEKVWVFSGDSCTVEYHGTEKVLTPGDVLTIGSAAKETVGEPSEIPFEPYDLAVASLQPGEFDGVVETLINDDFAYFSPEQRSTITTKISKEIAAQLPPEPDPKIRDAIDAEPSKDEKIRLINTHATELLEDQEVPEALVFMEYYRKKGIFDNNTLFLQSIAHKRIGNLEPAKERLVELLERERFAHRARLELSALQYQSGDLKAARTNLEQVKAAHPPRAVGENIEKFLAQVDAQTPRSVELSAAMGYFYDSNANAGPTTNSVMIFNLPFALSRDAQKSSDKGALLQVGMRYSELLDRYFAMSASASISATQYTHLKHLDTTLSSLSLGPSISYQPFTFSLPVIYSKMILGHDLDYYMASYGVAPELSMAVLPGLSVKTSLTSQRNDFEQTYPQDSYMQMLSFSARYFVLDSSFVELGWIGGQDNSKLDNYSQRWDAIQTSVFVTLTDSISLMMVPGVEWHKYQAAEVAFSNDPRHDTLQRMQSSIGYQYAPWGASVSLIHAYTNNKSNYTLGNYDRHQYSILFSKRF